MTREGGSLVLVAGYASIDVAYRASAPSAAGRTALLRGPVVPPARFGGCGPNAARELARQGVRTGLVTWLGDDAEGRAYRTALTAEGIDLRGSVVAAGEASPRCLLFYDPEGGAALYYHPSGSAALRLSPEAGELLAAARALVLAVAPAALAEALLDARPPGVPVAWNVKADPDAYPVALRRRLVEAADVVCLNRTELPFVAGALPDAPSRDGPDAADAAIAAIGRAGGIVVVTAGAAGSRVVWSDGEATVPASPVPVADPTGAGDAFFGAFVAAWLGAAAPDAAARVATERTAALLRERATEERAAGEGGG